MSRPRPGPGRTRGRPGRAYHQAADSDSYHQSPQPPTIGGPGAPAPSSPTAQHASAAARSAATIAAGSMAGAPRVRAETTPKPPRGVAATAAGPSFLLAAACMGAGAGLRWGCADGGGRVSGCGFAGDGWLIGKRSAAGAPTLVVEGAESSGDRCWEEGSLARRRPALMARAMAGASLQEGLLVEDEGRLGWCWSSKVRFVQSDS